MEKYYIHISNSITIIWLIIGILLTIASQGPLFITLIIPICYYFKLKNCKYYYNNEKLIAETGVFNKKQKIVPLYRIININAQDNIFNFGTIFIRDKEQTVVLKYVKHSKTEMMKLIEKWDNAKKANIRNEVI